MLTDEMAYRLWATAARMALDGVSALEDMLASGAPMPPDYHYLMTLLVNRVLRVSKEVARHGKKDAEPPGDGVL